MRQSTALLLFLHPDTADYGALARHVFGDETMGSIRRTKKLLAALRGRGWDIREGRDGYRDNGGMVSADGVYLDKVDYRVVQSFREELAVWPKASAPPGRAHWFSLATGAKE